jgi:hypothetical protein
MQEKEYICLHPLMYKVKETEYFFDKIELFFIIHVVTVLWMTVGIVAV